MHDHRQGQECGSRLAIVFSGSPLFTGSAGSGESNTRCWIIEKDWLEAIIALPRKAIDLLKERRAALISAAVTGRVAVVNGTEGRPK